MDAQDRMIDEQASDSLAVAPPPPSEPCPPPVRSGSSEARESQADSPHPTNHVRTALDAHDVGALARNPSDDDAKLDVALDESFPTSDAPSNTQPGKGKDPAPSSGYDEEAEHERMAAKE